MMADHHETDGSIIIEDPQTNDVYLHSPQTLLNHRQLVMVNDPYMLVQYIQFLKEFFEKTAYGYQRSHYQGRRSGVCKR